jgi:uncharacterized protein YdeI (YjbR/CyaY-like superfamily)
MLYVTDRETWRAWLQENHKTATEIWLVTYNKKSGKPKIPYDEAVEEALCFGWIDSIMKKPDVDSMAQRFSPRRKNSRLSELNRARVKKMIAQGRMTEAGLESLNHHLKMEDGVLIEKRPFVMPEDIRSKLKEDPQVWKNFESFPETYIQVRIGWIDMARSRPDIFETRLRYFIRMTRLNKQFGSQVTKHKP